MRNAAPNADEVGISLPLRDGVEGGIKTLGPVAFSIYFGLNSAKLLLLASELFLGEICVNLIYVDVKSVELQDLPRSFELDDVYKPEVAVSLLREVGANLTRYQDGHAIMLRSAFQLLGHLYVWGKVRGINLVEGANGALNCPANVKSIAHLDLVARHARE
jgi:hypothetical protein